MVIFYLCVCLQVQKNEKKRKPLGHPPSLPPSLPPSQNSIVAVPNWTCRSFSTTPSFWVFTVKGTSK